MHFSGLKLGPNFRETSLLPQLRIGRSEETLGRSGETLIIVECDASFYFSAIRVCVLSPHSLWEFIWMLLSLLIICILFLIASIYSLCCSYHHQFKAIAKEWSVSQATVMFVHNQISFLDYHIKYLEGFKRLRN